MWVGGAVPLAQALDPLAVVGGFAMLAALTVVAAVWAARRRASRALRPVEDLEKGLAGINADAAPLLRVPVPPAADDRVVRLSRTVNVTLDRLERAVDLQRHFAADASHELRTPITGLRTRIEVALADPDDTDLVATLRDALRDAERLQRIADDLLELARLDSGIAPVRAPLDLTALVRAELAGRRRRAVVSSRLEDGVLVDVDRLQLCRVLVSLLSNADRHAAERVEVTLLTEGDDVVLEVHDDGPGIGDGDRERVFERFARVDTARSRDRGGTGLGLAIAREIVHAHGGRLYVGASDHGARLILRLPRHTAEEGDDGVPGRPEPSVLRSPVPPMTVTREEGG
ncbi:sensor histidine kinase [Spirillospora sp. CA-255316]